MRLLRRDVQRMPCVPWLTILWACCNIGMFPEVPLSATTCCSSSPAPNLPALQLLKADGPLADLAPDLACLIWKLHRYCEHLGSRLPVVVVSDSLAAKLGAVDAGAPAQQGGSSSAGAAAPGGDDEDAELEALLRQMDINVDAGSAPGSMGLAASSSLPLEGLKSGAPAASPPAVPGTATQQAQQVQQVPQAQHVPLGPGVHVLSVAQYFGRFYSGSPGVLDLFESKLQSAAEEASKGGGSEAAAAGHGSNAGGGYRPHLSSAAVDSGLAQGQLLQVRNQARARAMQFP